MNLLLVVRLCGSLLPPAPSLTQFQTSNPARDLASAAHLTTLAAVPEAKPSEPKPENSSDILALEKETEGLLGDIVKGGAK
jgi:hypothetical protein